MMATEATSNSENIANKTPDHDLSTTIDTETEIPSQDVLPKAPLTNVTKTEKDEESKQDSESADAIINSAEVSVSGGSDNEALSKAETSKGQDEKGHVRTSSTVKKFTSFKPVSVNKTFLAAKAGSAATTTKPGDKPAAAAAQTGTSTTAPARPRLIAKSGSGIRDSAPRTATMTNGGKPGAAPDASAVWNKNRPAPTPEPKRFTDEELKQRYGIHLATRLQSDDPGKQANWADIDDDDDDWAPETIEWTDGTKITLPQADEQPPAPEPASISNARGMEAGNPSKSPAPQASPSPSLKSSGQSSSGRTGLVLKGAAEKPTLVAKPPGPPTPVKSPWATLPPVEKVAPVQIDIPQAQPQQSRFSQRDPHGFSGMPPPPAKEIAADDFSRSWREGNSNTSRELYNSQSGRYEPVTDNRRGGRQDSRQPSVLQRPSQQDGLAEPSAAFQTHRASGQDGVYRRRRTSSNVSGGSGNFLRKMSRGQHDMPPPHDMLNMRRGSLAAVSDAPSSPRNFSPSGQHPNTRPYQNQQWQSRASPVVSHPSPQSVHGQVFPPGSVPTDNNGQPLNLAPQEDPIEAQKKIMRQTRELAIKRRQEEEAQEEAARKERIRIKLEAMGPPPETKKTKKDAPKEEKPVPTQIQARDSSNNTAISETKPTAEAELKSSEAMNGPVEQKLSHDAKLKPSTQDQGRPNGYYQGVSQGATHQPSQDSRAQLWQNTSASGPWSSAPQQNASRNVWGPPSNDRTLGNGTFNSDLSSRMPEVHQPSSHPGPIGPPNSNRGNKTFQQGRGRESYTSRPLPIGPPNKQNGSVRDQQRAQAAAAWKNLPEKLAQDDKLLAQQQNAEIARNRELHEAGIAIGQPIVQDTWRQVNMNDDGTRGKTASVITTLQEGAAPTAPAGMRNQEAVPRPALEEQNMARQLSGRNDMPQFHDAWKSRPNINPSPPVRGSSRFFPTRDIRLDGPNLTFSDRPGSSSPPPPTMLGHPAYDGDIAHPHVSLPRPSPVVKLPPAVLPPIGPPKPVNFAAAVAAPAPQNPNAYTGRQSYSSRAAQSYQDIRRTEAVGSTAGAWQDRINHLIGRKNSLPRTQALTIDSSSKNALELHKSHMAATVSLPTSAGPRTDYEPPTSKPAAEECFEEQEMGSLPPVKLPHMAPTSAWTPAAPGKGFPRKFLVQPTSIGAFPQQASHIVNVISIMLPGQTEAKSVNHQASRQKSNPRRGNHCGSSRQASTSHRGGRGRDASGGFSPNPDHASMSSPMASGRGHGRGYGNQWNRHASTPVS